MVEILHERQRNLCKLSRGSEFLSKYVLTTPRGKYWKTEYYDEGLCFTFIAKERNDEDEFMLICLFFESIRQQITTGIGLQCPFWNAQINECCLEHRSDLELVWKNTTHNPSWQYWERKGCLRT